MRYAILSDIHSNRQALKAVLTDIRTSSVDEIIFLGGLVGYGPSPLEVVEMAYTNINHFILGNHDAVICGKLLPIYFNDNAKRIIEWTASKLDPGTSKFFGRMPLVLSGNGFRCTHGEFDDPGRYGYIIDEHEAKSAFSTCYEEILFAGHSHLPCIFVTGHSRAIYQLNPQDFCLENEKKYIVNVGSVGQPRDGDIRASYCIYDTVKKDIVFRKIPFDIDAYCEDLSKAKIEEKSSYFIGVYRHQPARQIRELLDFKRVNENDTVKTPADIKNLEKNLKKLRRTKIILIILLIVFLLMSFSGLILFLNQKAESKKVSQKLAEIKIESQKYMKTVFEAKEKNTISSSSFTADQEILQMPDGKGVIGKDNLIDGWSVSVTDPQKQIVSMETEKDKKAGDLAVIRIYSETPSEIEISYNPILVQQGQRFTASAQFKSIAFESGWAGIFIEEEMASGVKKILADKSPELKEIDRWIPTSITLAKGIKESTKLRFIIRAQFKGSILVRKCSLKKKE